MRQGVAARSNGRQGRKFGLTQAFVSPSSPPLRDVQTAFL
jgi:hypothetical protein